MEVKLLEIRDRATFIPAFAARPMPQPPVDKYIAQMYLLRRAGYSCDPTQPIVIFGYLRGGTCYYSPYDWGNGSRTMQAAHHYIAKHFDELKDGDVVDVEFISGEAESPKISERLEQ